MEFAPYGDLLSDCCISKAAAEVGRIRVNRMTVGISNLNGIFEEVMGLEGDELRTEIVRVASIYNFIPSEKRDDYTEGLVEAFSSWMDRDQDRVIR